MTLAAEPNASKIVERPAAAGRRTRRFAAAIVAAVAWFALALQLGLILATAVREGKPVAAEIVRYFSYFTILTNLVVAVAASAAAFVPQTRIGQWFAQPRVAGGIVLAIAFVGLAYEVLLRRTWNPQGWQRVADTLLRVATPVLFVAYWAVFVGHRALTSRDIGWWLAYPALYAAYAMARGAASGDYPYHFLDPATVGAHGSAAAIVFLCVAMAVLAAVFVALDRLLPSRRGH